MTGDLQTILLDELGLNRDGLHPDASLRDAGFDSLTIVELSVALRERFGIEVGETEIESARTLGELDRLVQSRRAGR